jgi:hypothetical protein
LYTQNGCAAKRRIASRRAALRVCDAQSRSGRGGARDATTAHGADVLRHRTRGVGAAPRNPESFRNALEVAGESAQRSVQACACRRDMARTWLSSEPLASPARHFYTANWILRLSWRKFVRRLVFVLALVVFALPATGALETVCNVTCADEACSSDCPECFCCSTARAFMLAGFQAESFDPPDEPLLPATQTVHSTAHPLEISHVPKPVLS